MKYIIVFLTFNVLGFLGCYSFKSTSIDAAINTFYVPLMENRVDNGPATLAITFTEKLKDKVRSQSRLRFQDTDPDLSFIGTVEAFNVTSQAPTSDNISALSRLTISIKIDFENRHDETKNWSQSFSYFQDFDGRTNLLDVQQNLINTISNQIAEDIFNRAFGDW